MSQRPLGTSDKRKDLAAMFTPAFAVVWKSGCWVMGVGSEEWGASNEEEVIGVRISLLLKVFNLKVLCTEISRRNLVSMSKN